MKLPSVGIAWNIVPIEFNQATANAIWQPLIVGLPAESENPTRLRQSGTSCDRMDRKIIRYTHRKLVMKRMVWGMLSIFFVLLAAASVAGYLATTYITEARVQRVRAKAATALSDIKKEANDATELATQKASEAAIGSRHDFEITLWNTKR